MILWLLLGCRPEPTPVLPVALPAPAVALPPRRIGYVGVIVPHRTVVLSAHGIGVVERSGFEVGEPVMSGTLVATVRSPTLPAVIEAAKAEVEVAIIEAAAATQTADASHRRAEEAESLLRRGAIAQTEALQLRLQRDRDALGARQKNAAVDVRKAKLDKWFADHQAGRLVAPFDGRLSRWFVANGERVEAGEPVLRLAATDELKVRFAVPAAHTGRIGVSEKVEVVLDDGGGALDATVDHVAPELDPSSQMTFVVASVVTQGDETLAGRACHVFVGH
ncbi:MAG: HlyD family efflux transporter periplasmic adaptor subunit [Myxococcota bacterium]